MNYIFYVSAVKRQGAFKRTESPDGLRHFCYIWLDKVLKNKGRERFLDL